MGRRVQRCRGRGSEDEPLSVSTLHGGVTLDVGKKRYVDVCSMESFVKCSIWGTTSLDKSRAFFLTSPHASHAPHGLSAPPTRAAPLPSLHAAASPPPGRLCLPPLLSPTTNGRASAQGSPRCPAAPSRNVLRTHGSAPADATLPAAALPPMLCRLYRIRLLRLPLLMPTHSHSTLRLCARVRRVQSSAQCLRRSASHTRRYQLPYRGASLPGPARPAPARLAAILSAAGPKNAMLYRQDCARL